MEKDLAYSFRLFNGVSAPEGGIFSQAYVEEPHTLEEVSLGGTLFLVQDFTVSGQDHALEGSRLVWEAVRQTYRSQLEGGPLPALERSLLSAHRQLLQFTLGSRGVAPSDVDFNAVAAVLWGNILYLAVVGSSAAWLWREGQIKKFEGGGGQKTAEPFLQVASGLLSPGDRVVLLSSAFQSVLLEGELANDPWEGLLRKKLEVAEKKAAFSALLLELGGLRDEKTSGVVMTGVGPAKSFLLRWQEQAGRVLGVILAGARWLWARRAWRRGEETIYLVHKPREPRRLSPLALLIFLTLLLTVSVLFTLVQADRQRREKEADGLLLKAGGKIEAASKLIDLNNSRANALLLEAGGELETVRRLGTREEEYLKLKTSFTEALDRVEKVKRVSLKLLYDFHLSDPASAPISFVWFEGSFYVVDGAKSKLYRVSPTEPLAKVEEVAGVALSRPKKMRLEKGRLLFLHSEGIAEWRVKEKTFQPKVAETGIDWEKVSSFDTYLTNLYLLLPSENRILKLVRGEKGYGGERDWLKESVTLTGSREMEVDGNLYLLSPEGLLKFSVGKSADLTLSGLSRPLREISVIFTRPESQYLYLLSSQAGRIYLFDKNGFFQKQIVFGEGEKLLGEALALWVDEASSRFYLLAGSGLYEAPI